MTQEMSDLLDQTVAFVRIRRTSRRASAAEARAALTLEDLLEEFRSKQVPTPTLAPKEAEVVE